MVHFPQEYYVGWFVFVISRHFEASVGIGTYCTQPSLTKKRKGPDKSFIQDADVLSVSDDDKDEEEEDEDEDNNEYFRYDFVVDNCAEEEEEEASIPRRCKNNNLEDSDKDDNGDESKGGKL